MSSQPKIPKFPPLTPPRPTGPANRAIAEQAVAEIAKRQSDHEIKVDGDVRAIARYIAQKETNDRELAMAVCLVARAVGIEEQLPPGIQSATWPPNAKAQPKTVHENARTSARAAHGTWAAILLLLVEIAIQLARHQ